MKCVLFRPRLAGRAAFLSLLIWVAVAPGAHAAGVPMPALRPEAVSPRILSSGDVDTLRTIMQKARNTGWRSALPLLSRVEDPVAAKVVRWLYLQQAGSGASFSDIDIFIRENPDWPRQGLLRELAEKAMDDDLPPHRVIGWFTERKPITGEGMLRLGEAHLASGRATVGTAWIQKAWSATDLSLRAERRILTRHKARLSRRDHDERLDQLVWAGQTRAARRMLPLASPNVAALARARIKLRTDAGGVDAAIAAIPKGLEKDGGLIYERIRWRRRRNRDEETWPLFLEAPKDAGGLGHPVRWWYERRLQSREALQAGKPDLAYGILRHHGLTRGHAFADTEWKAGWIALRYLNRPEDAAFHFARLATKVSRPISRGRAAYWQGRAAEALGDEAAAQGFYREGSAYLQTFYGQLAGQRAGGTANRMSLDRPVAVDEEDVAAFESAELTRAVLIASDFTSDYIVRLMLLHLVDVDSSAAGHALAARLAHRIDMPNMAVRIGKLASYEGHPSSDYSYPVFDLPEYQGKGQEPEPALTHAIIRQESEFNPRAISRAKARGLMQILPSTARLTARRHGLSYQVAWLTEKPEYNTQIGRAFLSDLLERYEGSYIMTAAAYNAGPSRVDRWIREFGDPREPGTDPVDWVENIPFRETRNYVQRVMEANQVYRARLINAPYRVTLAFDLKRGPYTDHGGTDGVGFADAGAPNGPLLSPPDPAAAALAPMPAVPSDRHPVAPSRMAFDAGSPAEPAPEDAESSQGGSSPDAVAMSELTASHDEVLEVLPVQRPTEELDPEDVVLAPRAVPEPLPRVDTLVSPGARPDAPPDAPQDAPVARRTQDVVPAPRPDIPLDGPPS